MQVAQQAVAHNPTRALAGLASPNMLSAASALVTINLEKQHTDVCRRTSHVEEVTVNYSSAMQILLVHSAPYFGIIPPETTPH